MMNDFIRNISKEEEAITEKVFSGKRLNREEALFLFKKSSLGLLAYLANYKKEKAFGKDVFYNKNTHLEISNRCINKCKFCSFYREKGMPDCWDLEIPDVIEILQDNSLKDITEIHITGGLHPDKTSKFYCELFSKIKSKFPKIHIKAFTAVEIEFFAKSDKLSSIEVLNLLTEHGLNSLAGGGAEILNDGVRQMICPEKTNSETWLRIHKEAHQAGLSTNCTMLYGHIESFENRIEHMEKLRNLQDETKGFNCFIPLKYRVFGNDLNVQKETNLLDELKTYSIARLFLNNIPHLKAYWPMTGKGNAALSLSFGVDDIDGTISNSTKIYSMAGSKEQSPEMSEKEMVELIEKDGFVAKERDSEYRIL